MTISSNSGGGSHPHPDADRLLRPIEQQLLAVVAGAPVILFALGAEGTIILSETTTPELSVVRSMIPEAG